VKILITGANGYIGQGVVSEFVQRGVDVIASDISIDNIKDDICKISGNIFELEDPYTYLHEPDILVHLAWRDGFKHNADSHMIDLPKHYLFLKKMMDSGVKKVCVMGSMHEVGFYEGSINENTPCNPMSLYGIAKNALRNAVSLYAEERKIDFMWLRGYYIVGHAEYGSSIFSKIVQAVREGKKEFPFTTGQNQYDFLKYEDFCKQVVSAALQDDIKGIINCCSGYPQKLADAVEDFIKEKKYPIKLKYGVYPERAYDSKAVWGDAKMINEIMAKEEENGQFK
jgi:nucleoside-diphosphate-sugar epimerase